MPHYYNTDNTPLKKFQMQKMETNRNVEVIQNTQRKHCLTFFEFLKHNIQSSINEDKVARVLVELDESLEGCVVIWVDEGKVLDKQDRDDICTFPFIHRNPGISCVQK